MCDASVEGAFQPFLFHKEHPMADNLITPQDDELDVEELENVAGGVGLGEEAFADATNNCTNGSQCQCPN
jgi:hypothetical protein